MNGIFDVDAPVVVNVEPFQYIINRIDSITSIPKEEQENKHETIIPILEMNLENLDERDKEKVNECIRIIKEDIDVALQLDKIDNIYLLANKKKRFGYNLSGKIERYIQSLE